MSRWRNIKQKQDKNEPINNDSNISSNLCLNISSRFKAFLLDSFLLTTPILYFVMYVIMGDGTSFAEDRALGWSLILFIHLPIIVLLWKLKRQTPGLRAYDLAVVNNTTQMNISFIQALSRYFITSISIISFFLIFLPFFRKDKKTLQDIITNTIIINKK